MTILTSCAPPAKHNVSLPCTHPNLRPAFLDQTLGVYCPDCQAVQGCWENMHVSEAMWDLAVLAKKENILYKQTKGFHTRWSIGVVSVRYFDLNHPKDDVARWRPIATYVTSTPTHSREGLSTAEVQLGIGDCYLSRCKLRQGKISAPRTVVPT